MGLYAVRPLSPKKIKLPLDSNICSTYDGIMIPALLDLPAVPTAQVRLGGDELKRDGSGLVESQRVALVELHRFIDGLGPRLCGGDADHVLVELDRAVRRLEAVKLSVVAAADAARVAARTGLADTSSWLAQRTHTGTARAASDVKLAAALHDPQTPSRPTSRALNDGVLSAEHARVILKATAQLPTGLAPEQVTAVEQDLVGKAQRLAPDQLRRVARRALAAVEPDRVAVDAHEDRLLREEEQAALDKTRLTLHDNCDGTTSGHFTVPTMAAAILTRAIHSITSPRRARLGASVAQAGNPTQRQDHAHAAGLALVELLEHLPTDRLHGKVAATVVVTIDQTRLQDAVGAAGLDTGESLSASQLRRLACGAGILPAVLGGQSLPLDLGRTSRLFTETQRVALATRHSTCAADGCQRPYSWCELHHQQPWSHGGTTNLADAIPLCGFHHRRIHDPAYRHRTGPGGITFHQRP